ncbi:DUF4134 family protein [Chryseobacterium sp. POE27]|uniref:DUF4134 family protein n=1 Tax=Chryseobacterium sp. POE27 TaxID=3138177 RepID=UPI0032197B65
MAITPAFAQGGATAISNAASDITDYWDPVKLILKAVGGLVGFIGGLRVYNKWTNGDQDVNKEILGYGGSNDLLDCSSGIRNSILCLIWDSTFIRG